MARRFISVRATDLDPGKLRSVCSSYFAYEHARTVRQVLTRRVLLLVLGTGALTLGAHVLPNGALATVTALAVVCVALCVRIEIKARGQFVEELNGVSPADPVEMR